LRGDNKISTEYDDNGQIASWATLIE
jgi:hypothetical protein